VSPCVQRGYNSLHVRVPYWQFGDWWTGQLEGDDNVVIDLHLYDCYGTSSQRTLEEHLDQAKAWAVAIENFKARGHNVLVGEWSLATGAHPGGQVWADAQLEAFSSGVGWFFWSYKKEDLGISDDDGGDTWSLRGVLRGGIRGLGDAKLLRMNATLGEAAGGQSPESGPVAFTGTRDERPGDSTTDEGGAGPFGPALVGRVEARRPYGPLYPGGRSAALLGVLCGVGIVVAIASLVTTSRSTSDTSARHTRRMLVGSAAGTADAASDLEYVRMPDQVQHRQDQPRVQPWKPSSRFVVELRHQALEHAAPESCVL
jgi:hypothetical protein